MIQKENLVQELINIYNFGYDYQNSEEPEKIKNAFKDAFKIHVTDRLGEVYDLTKFVIIEQNYIESEWKEMVARHYIHSTYAKGLRQTVFRVHLLCADEFTEDNYLGFITLRPIEELAISLSFIYINWRHRFFAMGNSYIMTFRKKIHYMGKSITIQT